MVGVGIGEAQPTIEPPRHLVRCIDLEIAAGCALIARQLQQCAAKRLSEAAASLGAPPWEVFWRVTLPSIRSGVAIGALFAFVMSFDEFTVTIFLVGATTQTLPIAVFHYLEWNTDPTVSAVSALLILLAVLVVFCIVRLFGLNRYVGVSD